MEALISSYGCMLLRLFVPDAKGRRKSVVLGLPNEVDYLQADTNYGGIVGRYANRIGGGGFELDNCFYPLEANLNGNMHLHGGFRGFDRRWWKVQHMDSHQVQFKYLSPDGEEGYPGNLETRIGYRLDDQNRLHLLCEATTDRPTVVSLSHHAYFNLGGNMDQDITSHELRLFSDRYLPTDHYQIPLFPESVADTPFDFRLEKKIGKDLQSSHPQIRLANGYDHCFVTKAKDGETVPVAILSDPQSGRKMTLSSNQPGLQLYTANWLTPEVHDFEGKPLRPYHAVCMEPQQFPDAPNRPDFPTPVLRPGEIYRHETIFAFSWG